MFNRRVSKFRIGFIALMLALVLALSAGACDDGGGGGTDGGGTDSSNTGGNTGGSTGTTSSSMSYDANLCQYFQVGDLRINGLYCAMPVSGANVPTFDFYSQSDQTKRPVYRQEFAPGTEAYSIQYWYSAQQWTRRLSSGMGDVEQCWRASTETACEWVTVAEYNQRLQAQVQAQQLSQQQAAQSKQAAEAAAEANRIETARALAELQERKIRAGSVFLQPDCNWSYNGCR